MYIGKTLNKLEDFDTHKCKFAAVVNKSYSESDGWGGTNYVTIAEFTGLKDEQEVSDWIKDRMNSHKATEKYKILRFEPVEIVTEVTVKVGI